MSDAPHWLAGCAAAPDWYITLMNTPMAEHRIDVAGTTIEVLAWGEAGRPGILLIHGNRAHARWWGPVPPLLATEYRVASLSLSGMGGSGWRDRYSTDLQIEEAFAAARIAGLFEASCAPVFVAHSYGTVVAALVAGRRGDAVSGAILVDTPISSQVLHAPPSLRRRGRCYPDLTEALSRFQLLPRQPVQHPFIVDDVARHSVQRTNGRWRWRFDPDFMEKLDYDTGWSELGAARCPLGFIFGERSSVVTPEHIARQRAHAPAGTPFIGIPGAAHHVMLDEPFALVAAIRALITGWRKPG